MNTFGAIGASRVTKRVSAIGIGLGSVFLLLGSCQPSRKPTTSVQTEPRVIIAPPLGRQPILDENTAATLINKYPTSATAYYEMGRMLHAHRRFAEAIPFFKKCIERDPLHISAYFGLAESYRYSEPSQWTLAEQTYKDLLKLAYTAPQRVDAYMGLGNLYLDWHTKEKREAFLVKALGAYQSAFDEDKQISSAAYGIGIVYARKQQWDKAERWFQKALSLAKRPREKAQALEALANIAMVRGEKAKAEKLIEEARQAHPPYEATLWEQVENK